MKSKAKSLKIIFLVTLIALVLWVNGGISIDLNRTARAVGDLSIDWGVPEGDPIFVVGNGAPGDCENRNVTVTNSASSARPIGVRGEKVSETQAVGTVLEIKVTAPSFVYGPKTLGQFFTESEGINGIPLLTQAPGNTTVYNFQVCLPDSAGNEFQNSQIIFDLIIGISVEVPEECSALEFSGDPIFGTSGSDRLNGGPGNDLILGFEGSDTINGNGGDDCIIGGDGSDSIRGNNGNDVILGQAGSDSLKGNNGDDRLYGGVGSDSLDGENGEDLLEGGSGADSLSGGNDSDTLLGGTEADSLKGGNGDDDLDGGQGIDSLKGDAGTDTCTNGETTQNCEI